MAVVNGPEPQPSSTTVNPGAMSGPRIFSGLCNQRRNGLLMTHANQGGQTSMRSDRLMIDRSEHTVALRIGVDPAAEEDLPAPCSVRVLFHLPVESVRGFRSSVSRNSRVAFHELAAAAALPAGVPPILNVPVASLVRCWFGNPKLWPALSYERCR